MGKKNILLAILGLDPDKEKNRERASRHGRTRPPTQPRKAKKWDSVRVRLSKDG